MKHTLIALFLSVIITGCTGSTSKVDITGGKKTNKNGFTAPTTELINSALHTMDQKDNFLLLNEVTKGNARKKGLILSTRDQLDQATKKCQLLGKPPEYGKPGRTENNYGYGGEDCPVIFEIGEDNNSQQKPGQDDASYKTSIRGGVNSYPLSKILTFSTFHLEREDSESVDKNNKEITYNYSRVYSFMDTKDSPLATNSLPINRVAETVLYTADPIYQKLTKVFTLDSKKFSATLELMNFDNQGKPRSTPTFINGLAVSPEEFLKHFEHIFFRKKSIDNSDAKTLQELIALNLSHPREIQ
ncbi:MAG: hypothetical protein HOO06_11205 [Bdellovibrionaceae bacterium]|jgi:hypothetical protein|nr:hypothetical protein [Pseudobdellovibrionaceae bacterium]